MAHSEYLKCYVLIKSYYGNDRAKRSKVLLMNHIEEGVAILQAIEQQTFSDAQCAFLIHPIVQNNVTTFDLTVVKPSVLRLAREYKNFANAYLCCEATDHIKSVADLKRHFGRHKMSNECARMLYADKIQNRKDFLLYHVNSHERKTELFNYFNIWIDYLIQEYRIFAL